MKWEKKMCTYELLKIYYNQLIRIICIFWKQLYFDIKLSIAVLMVLDESHHVFIQKKIAI